MDVKFVIIRGYIKAMKWQKLSYKKLAYPYNIHKILSALSRDFTASKQELGSARE